jgi:hypothetical protein
MFYTTDFSYNYFISGNVYISICFMTMFILNSEGENKIKISWSSGEYLGKTHEYGEVVTPI